MKTAEHTRDRERIEAILACQRKERLEALREEVRAEKRPPAAETQDPEKKRKAS